MKFMSNGNGDVQGEVVAQKAGKLINTRSKFDTLGYNFFTTNRFGEISPFFVMENLDGDKNNKLLSSSKVDSYTLKAPLMQDIKMKKEIFYVPRQALLPLNWEKFYTNPNIGDDVPDDCGTTVKGFWKKCGDWLVNEFSDIEADYSALDSDSATFNDDILALVNRYFKWLFISEAMFSDGSLVAQLGENGSKFLRVEDNSIFGDYGFHSFDAYFDAVFSYLASSGVTDEAGVLFKVTTPDSFSYLVSASGKEVTSAQLNSLSYREFCDMMRDDVSSLTFVSDVYADFSPDAFLAYVLTPSFYNDAAETDHLDLARLWSYQLVCAHFFTNDHVDYIYSADLFRQYILDLATRLISVTGGSATLLGQFSWNGVSLNYDALSAYYFNAVLSIWSVSPLGVRPESVADAFAYLQALLSYRHSLRFVDYFVASRTRPLAVGDTDVAVNSNKASVIDITRNIMMQKFLNAVNRVGRREDDYSEVMGGDGRRPDFHNPLWIGRTSDVVYGDRSEYTGNVDNAKRNNVTSLLKNAGGKYLFSWMEDRPGICIGVCYYDIERVYTKLIERQAFHVNRFDMFNPYQQFIGDQAIYPSELGVGGTGSSVTPFGYANRHIEYKLRVPRAAGGFVSDSGLPSWIFAAERGFRKYETNQSPTFIRSFNSEFDQFYVNLTGWSLGTYFHFIVRHINVCSASRPMVAAPDILQ